jgi:small subunit ribosomal protein S6
MISGTITKEFMRLYDLVVVTRPSLNDTQQKKVLDTVKGFLKDVNVASEESWGQKPLAYKIKKEIAGVFHFLKLETEKSVPTDFEKRLINEENIIRHLLVRTK